MARAPFTFELNKADTRRITRNLTRASGKNLYVRLQRATLTQGDIIAKKMQRAAPVGPTGNLKKSIRARPERVGNRFSGYRSTTTVLVGPDTRKGGYHRHLVISGTGERPSLSKRGRPSSPYRAFDGHVFRAGAFGTGRMPKNPFIDRVIQSGVKEDAARAIRDEWGKAARGI